MSIFSSKKLDNYAEKRFKTNKEFLSCLVSSGIDKKEDAIKKWRQGNSIPKTNELPIIADCLECNITDLFEDSDAQNERITKLEIAKNSSKYLNLMTIENNENIITLPYFEDMYACAGNGVTNFESNARPISFDKTFLRKYLGDIKFENLHMINVIGNSMHPTIKEKEIIFINPFENESQIVKSGAVYTLKYYDEVFIKRIVSNPKTGEIVLHSDNKEEHPPIEILEEDKHNFEIIGRVVAHFDWI